MKITLIYPRFKYEHVGGLQEPLGILYISSVLKKNGYDVKVIDLTFEKSFSVIRKNIAGSDIVGISVTTALFNTAKNVLNYIKKIDPSIPVVMGGPHATVLPNEILSSGFDYAIIGEGEETILDLLNVIKGKKRPEQVKGIAYKEKGKICFTEPRSYIKNVDKIPFPDRKALNYKQYFKNGMNHVGVFVTRGCPYNCLFCKPMQNKLFGNILRGRKVENVAREIEVIYKDYGNVKIIFKDDTIMTNGSQWFRNLKKEMDKRNIIIDGWLCQSRVDQINSELIEALKECGCEGISFGVESGSQKILNYYRKGIVVKQIISAFDMCRKAKIRTHAYIMFGAPEETRKDMEMTYKLIKKIKPDSISTSITTPAPGTDLYTGAEKKGILKISKGNKYYVDYLQDIMPMKLKHITREDIHRYKRKIDIYRFRRRFFRGLKSRGELKLLISTLIKNPEKIKAVIGS